MMMSQPSKESLQGQNPVQKRQSKSFKKPTFKTTYEYDVKSKDGHPVLSKVLFQRNY
jgi:hypothetical protein